MSAYKFSFLNWQLFLRGIARPVLLFSALNFIAFTHTNSKEIRIRTMKRRVFMKILFYVFILDLASSISSFTILSYLSTDYDHKVLKNFPLSFQFPFIPNLTRQTLICIDKHNELLSPDSTNEFLKGFCW